MGSGAVSPANDFQVIFKNYVGPKFFPRMNVSLKISVPGFFSE